MRTLVLVLVGLLMAGTASAHGRSDDGSSKWQGYRSHLVAQSEKPEQMHRRHGRSSRLDLLLNSNLNSGVCDELQDATPGLRMMCMAFCELQTCTPDYTLDNPFENCSRSSQWILARYEARRGPGDPDMPCLQQPETSPECPCWSREELANFRGQGARDRVASCFVNVESPANNISNYDAWQIFSDPNGPSPYKTTLSSAAMSSADGAPSCAMVDTCDPSTDVCLGTSRYMSITPEQLAACEADVAVSAADRGLTCQDLSP
jgi:hypothetical protein